MTEVEKLVNLTLEERLKQLTLLYTEVEHKGKFLPTLSLDDLPKFAKYAIEELGYRLVEPVHLEALGDEEILELLRMEFGEEPKFTCDINRIDLEDNMVYILDVLRYMVKAAIDSAKEKAGQLYKAKE